MEIIFLVIVLCIDCCDLFFVFMDVCVYVFDCAFIFIFILFSFFVFLKLWAEWIAFLHASAETDVGHVAVHFPPATAWSDMIHSAVCTIVLALNRMVIGY